MLQKTNSYNTTTMPKYGLRKLSIGFVSALLGTTLYITAASNTLNASADTVNKNSVNTEEIKDKAPTNINTDKVKQLAEQTNSIFAQTSGANSDNINSEQISDSANSEQTIVNPEAAQTNSDNNNNAQASSANTVTAKSDLASTNSDNQVTEQNNSANTNTSVSAKTDSTQTVTDNAKSSSAKSDDTVTTTQDSAQTNSDKAVTAKQNSVQTNSDNTNLEKTNTEQTQVTTDHVTTQGNLSDYILSNLKTTSLEPSNQPNNKTDKEWRTEFNNNSRIKDLTNLLSEQGTNAKVGIIEQNGSYFNFVVYHDNDAQEIIGFGHAELNAKNNKYIIVTDIPVTNNRFTRTILVNNPDGTTKPIKQNVMELTLRHYYFVGDDKPVTNSDVQYIGNPFPEVTIPTIEGYTPSQSIIPSETVTNKTLKDQIINVNYIKNNDAIPTNQALFASFATKLNVQPSVVSADALSASLLENKATTGAVTTSGKYLTQDQIKEFNSTMQKPDAGTAVGLISYTSQDGKVTKMTGVTYQLDNNMVLEQFELDFTYDKDGTSHVSLTPIGTAPVQTDHKYTRSITIKQPDGTSTTTNEEAIISTTVADKFNPESHAIDGKISTAYDISKLDQSKSPFANFEVPTIDGYTPSQSVIKGFDKWSADIPYNQEYTITYTKNSDSKPSNDTNKPTTPSSTDDNNAGKTDTPSTPDKPSTDNDNTGKTDTPSTPDKPSTGDDNTGKTDTPSIPDKPSTGDDNTGKTDTPTTPNPNDPDYKPAPTKTDAEWLKEFNGEYRSNMDDTQHIGIISQSGPMFSVALYNPKDNSVLATAQIDMSTDTFTPDNIDGKAMSGITYRRTFNTTLPDGTHRSQYWTVTIPANDIKFVADNKPLNATIDYSKVDKQFDEYKPIAINGYEPSLATIPAEKITKDTPLDQTFDITYKATSNASSGAVPDNNSAASSDNNSANLDNSSAAPSDNNSVSSDNSSAAPSDSNSATSDNSSAASSDNSSAASDNSSATSSDNSSAASDNSSAAPSGNNSAASDNSSAASSDNNSATSDNSSSASSDNSSASSDNSSAASSDNSSASSDNSSTASSDNNSVSSDTNSSAFSDNNSVSSDTNSSAFSDNNSVSSDTNSSASSDNNLASSDTNSSASSDNNLASSGNSSSASSDNNTTSSDNSSATSSDNSSTNSSMPLTTNTPSLATMTNEFVPTNSNNALNLAQTNVQGNKDNAGLIALAGSSLLISLTTIGTRRKKINLK